MKRLFLLVLFSMMFTMVVVAQTESPEATKFYELTRATPKAYTDGEYEDSKAMALELLATSESWKKDWNYGNAVHVANLVLGRLELRDGNKEKAAEYLLAAGRTPGSPQLNSFGPDMLFAKEMLAADETDAVLNYLELCSKFWERKQGRTNHWRAEIKTGIVPDFGANLRYFF